MSSVINATIYQIGWFACVLGAAWGRGTEGALLAILLTSLHVAFAARPRAEVAVVAVAVLCGAVLDTLHSGFGILRFEGHVPGTLAPLWILALWAQFGTVLHYCMRWLSRRYLLASLLGAVGGPLSFLAGERLGAAAFGEPRLACLAVLALSWSLALPLLVVAADRIDAGPGAYRNLLADLGTRPPQPVPVPVRARRSE